MGTSELSGFISSNQNRNNGGDHNMNDGMMNGDGLMMMMMMAEVKQNSGEGNLTRDFLGMEQELINFSCSMNDPSIGFSGSQ